MKNIFFSIALLVGFFLVQSASAASPLLECTNVTDAACVAGACPSGSKQVTATCTNNRTCCQKSSVADKTITAAQCTEQGGTCGQAQCNDGKNGAPAQDFLGWCPASPQGCCKNRTGGGSGTGTLGGGSEVNITVSNPLKYDTVEGVLTSVMSGLKTIVVTLALLMIVIGGIMYILSLGNPDNMKKAKNIILAALIGLAIVLAAPAFLKEIYSLLGGGPGAEQLSGSLTLTQIAKNVLNFLLSIIGILALIMMVISGIMYLTSMGNDTRLKQAKAIFVASLIGIGVAMASLILVSAVARFFV